jgi:hypothetical protein
MKIRHYISEKARMGFLALGFNEEIYSARNNKIVGILLELKSG